jgi:hypothetical protein
MSTVIMYLDRDPNPGKQAEFERVAADLTIRFDTAAIGLHSGEQMLRVADFSDPEEVDHLICVCHGFSDRLLSAKAGVHAAKHTPPAVVSLDVFARTWAPKMTRHCKVSLCACSCAREPYSKEAVWGPSAHTDGGVGSFAGKLRDALLDRGVLAEVRAHCTPGHVTMNPACRGFVPKKREPGMSLFTESVGRVLGVKPTWGSARHFNTLVKGALAARWITFADDKVVEDIVSQWKV